MFHRIEFTQQWRQKIKFNRQRLVILGQGYVTCSLKNISPRPQPPWWPSSPLPPYWWHCSLRCCHPCNTDQLPWFPVLFFLNSCLMIIISMSFQKLAAKWWQHERPTNKLMIKTKVIAIAVISIWSKFYLGLSALTLGGGLQAGLWWGHTPSQHNHEDCRYQPSIAIIMVSKGWCWSKQVC